MDKYSVQKVVGQGSYGRAVLSKRKTDNKLCIIKEISLAKLSKKDAKQTEQEATLLSKLKHPNIVTFWESFISKSVLYIVMEFADGGDLDHYIKDHSKKARGYIPEVQVLNLFVQLCLAIKHIHDRKILHRDLKSQNIFLTSTGLLKLGDFGVSRVLSNTTALASTQIGTPYFMSPEIMQNERYNSKTDIWSLGCILYELMCLKLPFGGNSMKELVNNIVRTNPAPPSSSYSNELRELVKETLIKNPKTRPGINSILSRNIMKQRIANFLNETKINNEFNHTILHGMDILRANNIDISKAKPIIVALIPPTNNAKVIAPSKISAVAIPQQQKPPQPQSNNEAYLSYLQYQKQQMEMVKLKEEQAQLSKQAMIKQENERLKQIQKQQQYEAEKRKEAEKEKEKALLIVAQQRREREKEREIQKLKEAENLRIAAENKYIMQQKQQMLQIQQRAIKLEKKVKEQNNNPNNNNNNKQFRLKGAQRKPQVPTRAALAAQKALAANPSRANNNKINQNVGPELVVGGFQKIIAEKVIVSNNNIPRKPSRDNKRDNSAELETKKEMEKKAQQYEKAKQIKDLIMQQQKQFKNQNDFINNQNRNQIEIKPVNNNIVLEPKIMLSVANDDDSVIIKKKIPVPVSNEKKNDPFPLPLAAPLFSPLKSPNAEYRNKMAIDAVNKAQEVLNVIERLKAKQIMQKQSAANNDKVHSNQINQQNDKINIIVDNNNNNNKMLVFENKQPKKDLMPWLSNLESQMGALKQQVGQMQVEFRSPKKPVAIQESVIPTPNNRKSNGLVDEPSQVSSFPNRDSKSPVPIAASAHRERGSNASSHGGGTFSESGNLEMRKEQRLHHQVALREFLKSKRQGLPKPINTYQDSNNSDLKTNIQSDNIPIDNHINDKPFAVPNIINSNNNNNPSRKKSISPVPPTNNNNSKSVLSKPPKNINNKKNNVNKMNEKKQKNEKVSNNKNQKMKRDDESVNSSKSTFNLAEFRSQKEKDRDEMKKAIIKQRQLLKEKKAAGQRAVALLNYEDDEEEEDTVKYSYNNQQDYPDQPGDMDEDNDDNNNDNSNDEEDNEEMDFSQLDEIDRKYEGEMVNNNYEKINGDGIEISVSLRSSRKVWEDTRDNDVTPVYLEMNQEEDRKVKKKLNYGENNH
eukprot:gene5433-7526_t